MSTLPPWPSLAPVTGTHGVTLANYVQDQRDAALARLRACEPYLQHADDCATDKNYFNATVKCSCGLDELLATLLPEGRATDQS